VGGFATFRHSPMRHPACQWHFIGGWRGAIGQWRHCWVDWNTSAILECLSTVGEIGHS
jgi:hypothetical protein